MLINKVAEVPKLQARIAKAVHFFGRLFDDMVRQLIALGEGLVELSKVVLGLEHLLGEHVHHFRLH